MSEKSHDVDTIELACLGRPFQLGMLYDSRKDAIVPAISPWDPGVLQDNISEITKPETHFTFIASDSSENKVKALNISPSLEASFLSGLVSVEGSAGYLQNKKKSKRQCRVTLHYQTTTKYVSLTMKHLGQGNVNHSNVFQKSSATHVVTALMYGAQAFFIFDREVSTNEKFHEVHGDLKASIEKIPQISCGGEISLTTCELDKEKINKFSCTFHGDFALKNNPVTYQDAIKVYSELPQLLGENGENAVPMTAWLYPLEKLDSTATKIVREINVSLVQRGQRTMDELDDCDVQCEDLMRDSVVIQFPEIKAKLRNFKDLCSRYILVFQKRLFQIIPSIRAGKTEELKLADALNDTESSPFKSALLNKYLDERVREINVVGSYLDIMKSVNVLSTSNNLDKVVLKQSNDYVIVFALSSLNENEPYLSDLENYLDNRTDLEQLNKDKQSSTDRPGKWFLSEDATTLTRETIQAFLDFKEANKERTNIEFCIASIPDELSTASSIHVYEKGKLLSSRYELPSKPPMPVFLSAEHDCVHLQIKPPDHGVSSVNSYCISYRSTQSSEWTEVFTDGVSDQVTIKQLKPHTEYCFTCKAVCRPGVSLTSDPTSFFRTRPCAPPGAPKVKRVQSESAVLAWDVPTSVGEDVMITSYVLEYRERPKDQEIEKLWISVKSTSRECTLQRPKQDTDYTVRVFANCGNDGMSLPSPETVVSACSESKPSHKAGSGLFLNQSSCIHRGNPSIYKLTLQKKCEENEDFHQYVFGRKVEDVKNKVILLLGATGAGKTTLINVMVNYILGVKWEDVYRFKLINEVTNRTQAESQTSKISSYELYNQPGFQIPDSLIIVDTPGFGDTRGIAHDKLITEQIKNFLRSPLGIDHIDAVCIVVQASLARLSASQMHIFDTILSIFGKDIAENIIFMVTFADSEKIPVLETIKAADLPCQKNKMGEPSYYKFNNSVVYADKIVKEPMFFDSDSDDDGEDSSNYLGEIFWKLAFKQMKAFFRALKTTETKDLTLTKDVLHQRECLERIMSELTPQFTDGLKKKNEIISIKKQLEKERMCMEQSMNFEQEVEVKTPKRTLIESFAMNCNECFFTCHSTCFLPAKDSVETCAVMDDSGHCVKCPKSCFYTVHSKEKAMWTYETKKEKKINEELKENFMKTKAQFMNTQQNLKEMETELTSIQDKLNQLTKMSSDCLSQLNATALKTRPFLNAEYLEILMNAEWEQKLPGFKERIAELKKIKKETALLEKIEKGQDLLTQKDIRKKQSNHFVNLLNIITSTVRDYYKT